MCTALPKQMGENLKYTCKLFSLLVKDREKLFWLTQFPIGVISTTNTDFIIFLSKTPFALTELNITRGVKYSAV